MSRQFLHRFSSFWRCGEPVLLSVYTHPSFCWSSQILLIFSVTPRPALCFCAACSFRTGSGKPRCAIAFAQSSGAVRGASFVNRIAASGIVLSFAQSVLPLALRVARAPGFVFMLFRLSDRDYMGPLALVVVRCPHDEQRYAVEHPNALGACFT